MCGACGRTVVADEVLGAERTLRSQHIVAQTITSLFATMPGLPSVRVAGDGWTVRTATGAVSSCNTVTELWTAVGSTVQPAVISVLYDGAQRGSATVSGLEQAVLLAGADVLGHLLLPSSEPA